MDTQAQKIIIIAGEASGDMHAAHLVNQIKKLNSHVTFSGLGGKAMAEAGVHIYEDLTKFAVIGVVEVFKHLKDFKRLFYFILQKIKEEKPDAVILVDYPGFNLRLAKKIHELGIKVIYYISPQVWAWKKNRVFFIQKYITRMMVLFKFEEEFYRHYNVKVDFVGHPLLETVYPALTKREVLSYLKLTDRKLTIGLLPGSRNKEIEKLLPPMLEAAQILNKEFPNIQFVIAQAPTIKKELLNQYAEKYSDLNLKISELPSYDSIYACDICIVASGTATLETALLGKPLIIVYKTNFITWFLGKLVIKIKHIGLPNIILKKSAVPELIQFDVTPQKIAKTTRDIITDETAIAIMKSNLKELRNALGSDIDSYRPAQIVLEELNKTR